MDVPTRLPAGSGSGTSVLHEVRADEADGFELVEARWETIDTLPVEVGRIRVAAIIGEGNEPLVRVTRLTSRFAGFPPRDRERVAFDLEAGDWGRVALNNRIGGANDWRYSKTVVNVAHLEAGQAPQHVRFTGEPPHALDEQERLR